MAFISNSIEICVQWFSDIMNLSPIVSCQHFWHYHVTQLHNTDIMYVYNCQYIARMAISCERGVISMNSKWPISLKCLKAQCKLICSIVDIYILSEYKRINQNWFTSLILYCWSKHAIIVLFRMRFFSSIINLSQVNWNPSNKAFILCFCLENLCIYISKEQH